MLNLEIKAVYLYVCVLQWLNYTLFFVSYGHF